MPTMHDETANSGFDEGLSEYRLRAFGSLTPQESTAKRKVEMLELRLEALMAQNNLAQTTIQVLLTMLIITDMRN